MTLIEVHQLHRQMHSNQGRVTNLFAINPFSLFGYLTVSPTHPVTVNLAYKVSRLGQTNYDTRVPVGYSTVPQA